MKRTLSLLFLSLVVVVALAPQQAKASEIFIGGTSTSVTLTNMGGDVIDVTFGTLSGTAVGSTVGTYTLSPTIPAPLAFTEGIPTQDFTPAANTFTATVLGLSTAASYTLMHSDGNVGFEGIWDGDQTFDYTLNHLTPVRGPRPPADDVLVALVGDPVGTTWKGTVSSGETTTPEPVSMLLMGSFLSLAGGFLSRKKRA